MFCHIVYSVSSPISKVWTYHHLKNYSIKARIALFLRFGLGNALFKSGQAAEAITHLIVADKKGDRQAVK